MNALSLQRMRDVHPELRERVGVIAAVLFKRNIVIEVVSGFRSYDVQAKLYAQGRSSPGKIVTNARAGSSWHNFGLAVDVCPMKRGAFDWNAPRAVWLEIGSTAQLHGLEWGGTWRTPDLPHLQLPVAHTLADLRAERDRRIHAELLAFVRVLDRRTAKKEV